MELVISSIYVPWFTWRWNWACLFCKKKKKRLNKSCIIFRDITFQNFKILYWMWLMLLPLKFMWPPCWCYWW